MANRKPAVPRFTLQMRVVTVVDYDIEASDMQQAVELSKTVRLTDLMEYADGVTENASSVKPVAVISQEDWHVD
jgi:hypothetical protein